MQSRSVRKKAYIFEKTFRRAVRPSHMIPETNITVLFLLRVHGLGDSVTVEQKPRTFGQMHSGLGEGTEA